MSSRLDEAAARLQRLADQLPYAVVHGVGDELETVAELANELVADTDHADLLPVVHNVRAEIESTGTSGLDSVRKALQDTAHAIRKASNHAGSTSSQPAPPTSPTKAHKLAGAKRPRHNRKDLERQFCALEAKGWAIQKTTSHWTAWCPCGKHRTGFSSTPSGQKDMHRANAALRLDCTGESS
ncbi:hypothetical protein [Saccharopolyspora elongata]|uniref:Uncharacterized protein n=1 Tax=Saccharopolyspora elongata TaxID=2530387 RepID=A0A4R4Y8N2_9PSEU|nr:hypothetical protein [Saccharopolyspora elongata]TDD40280.1 hypothetical protein E1288_35715 [Saccharopolyspora elongata]